MQKFRAAAASTSRPNQEFRFAVVLQNNAPKNSEPVASLDFLNRPGQARARHRTK
jgi:hypothetical protein